MKVPRDVDANDLIKFLEKNGYKIIRQTGSHIRLTKITDDAEHGITIPNHKPIKIGTLQNIAKDICEFNKIDIDDLYRQF